MLDLSVSLSTKDRNCKRKQETVINYISNTEKRVEVQNYSLGLGGLCGGGGLSESFFNT